jgi:hypothetical protein
MCFYGDLEKKGICTVSILSDICGVLVLKTSARSQQAEAGGTTLLVNLKFLTGLCTFCVTFWNTEEK